MVDRNNEIIEIAAEKKRETDDAYLLFDGDREVWVPKFLVQEDEEGIFQMPEWLALEKELINGINH